MIARKQISKKWIVLLVMAVALAAILTCCSPYPYPVPSHYCGGYSSDWNIKSRGNGIDRKDSNVGYVYENCVPCCSKCNFVKNKIPYKDFLHYIRRLYETTKDYQI